MAKDYFQDIMPPNSSEPARQSAPAVPTVNTQPPPSTTIASSASNAEMPEKTIRNIQVTPSLRPRPRIGADINEPPNVGRGKFGRVWLWGAVALAVLALAAIALVALRKTSVSVIPRAQNVVFDDSAVFTAYPSASAASGTLSYKLETITLEDSEIVPANGVERVEEKASGTIAIFNEYSSQPVKLLKNTRFATSDGRIFRAPAEVMVPGKKGSSAGQISVTVIADAAGEKYNSAQVDKLTLPGLKSSPDMYKTVYARGTSAMAGGFVGERPAAAKADVDAARAKIRDRLQAKILENVRAKNTEDTLAFADLAYSAFESLPQTAEAGGGARIHERVRVDLPTFSAGEFALSIAQSVSADAENGAVKLKDSDKLTANLRSALAAGSDSPIQFVLQGTAQLIWNIDTDGLAKALSGRDEAAFQAIVGGFPSIEEAHARIEPFWKKSFPTDPAAIRITIAEPKTTAQ